MGEEQLERRLAAIMAADVVGYSRLMEANEERTLGALRQHRREFFDPTVAKHKGRIFKVMGDGFLVEFGSVLDAARCAVEIQAGMPGRNAGVPEDRHIKFRIGINLGDIIVEGDDFYGDGVNLAARLEGLASPGGIACSAVVRNQVGNKLEIEFLDQGDKTVKNIAQPVHVYFVNMADAAPNGSPQVAASGAPQVRSDKPSVAILPFANMSNDPEQEFFSDGITEDIITDLSKVSGLFVLSRNSVFTYKGKAVNMDRIAKDLGVAFVVEGSVRKAGNRVRINAQLIEGATGGHVWADRYDRDLTDIFAIQDEITHTIVDQLKVNLLPEEKQAIAQAPTGNVEAYTYYLKGRELFHRGSKSYYAMAKRMFAKAIELDPLYARAYAGVADCDSFLYLDYSEGASLDGILANCAKALDLDPGLAEARASRGLALSAGQRYDEAEREFEQAIAGNPNLFEAHYFRARSCFVRGKLDEAAVHWERAAEVKPDDFQSCILPASIYRAQGRVKDQERALRRGAERAERALAANPENARAAYLLAGVYVGLGDAEKGKGWAERALAIDPDDVMARYNVACFYSLCGEIDHALDLLEALMPQSNPDMKAWILNDSDFEPLHGQPRWQKVLDLIR
ncbi:adenylate/guanylate cyclase domain-containing protein [Sphingomonas sp.]|uniref:adenylate/guanylate cyclase domain-containing protein n=1 Tax=Sphingomonas sp. TaxID=28214 RepID=UPI0025DD5EAA|nr:adenylate/guanylate cyclase domain-containing protein [Sphingomonas sp.]